MNMLKLPQIFTKSAILENIKSKLSVKGFTHVILVWKASLFKLGEDQLPVDYNFKATCNDITQRRR